MKKLISLVLGAGLLAGCGSVQEGVYQGGLLVKPGPLGLQGERTFRFIDKWRISLKFPHQQRKFSF